MFNRHKIQNTLINLFELISLYNLYLNNHFFIIESTPIKYCHFKINNNLSIILKIKDVFNIITVIKKKYFC